MDDYSVVRINTKTGGTLDTASLDRILDLGDGELRRALCTQLIADFQRLRRAIGDSDGPSVARAAHELKGLAATVGADRVADMARSLDFASQTVDPEVRRTMAQPIQREVDVILGFIHDAADRPID